MPQLKNTAQQLRKYPNIIIKKPISTTNFSLNKSDYYTKL